MKMKSRFGALLLVPMLAVPTFAQESYVYPAKGQSPEQTEKDKRDCSAWAKQQTGYDPSQPVVVAAPPPQEGQVARGGARGAAVGAMGGAIAGDAGKGAAIGAASGALLGGMRRRDQMRQQEAEQAQYQQAQAQNMSTFNRAQATCLQARGYSVN